MIPLHPRIMTDLSVVSRLRAGARRAGWFRHGTSWFALNLGRARGRSEESLRRTGDAPQRTSPNPVWPEADNQPLLPFAGETGGPEDGAVILRFPGRDDDREAVEQRAGTPEFEPVPVENRHLRRRRGKAVRIAVFVGKAALGTAAVGVGVVAIGAPIIAYTSQARVTQDLEPRIAARSAVLVSDSNGQSMGILPQDGSLEGVAAVGSNGPNRDFIRALRGLEESRTYYGISPDRIVRASGCFAWEGLLHGGGAAEQNCGGGSTLLMQAATHVRGGKDGRGTFGRKLTEIHDALALSVTVPAGYVDQDHFIADNLLFGHAGRPIIGVENAARIVFGKASSELSLGQASILAATPKRQLMFFCGTPSPVNLATAHRRWEAIRARADYALTQSFQGDPRLEAARAEVRAMPDRITPAPLAAKFVRGMTPQEACMAAADPVRRTELTDSSLRNLIGREMSNLPRTAGHPIAEIRLATSVDGQRTFKAEVDQALRGLETAQRGQWRQPLTGAGERADVLAMTTAPDGSITGLYTSNTRDLPFHRRRLGSLSKLAALLAFARAGRGPDTTLCNRATRGLRNANGNMGYADCSDPRSRVPLRTAFAQSLNLPIMEELRRIDPAIVARAARDAGFTDPGNNLPYALAFGLAEAEPQRVVATAAAMARGATGRPALAHMPHAISRYRVDDRWYDAPSRQVDLTAYFATDRARRLVAAAGGAALRSPDGTLRATVGRLGVQEGEIAKSGTDGRERLMTYAKTAAGARDGMGWFAMVAAGSGPVGGRHVSIANLVRIIREHALSPSR